MPPLPAFSAMVVPDAPLASTRSVAPLFTTRPSAVSFADSVTVYATALAGRHAVDVDVGTPAVQLAACSKLPLVPTDFHDVVQVVAALAAGAETTRVERA